MTPGSRVLASLVLPWLLAGPAGAEDTFDPSAYDRRPFEWTGFLEARPERQWLQRDTAGYALQYPEQSRGTADRLGAALELSGVARHRDLSFNFSGRASWLDEPRGNTRDFTSYEAYGAWQIDAATRLEAGKRALRWGKGYAWNPVAFLERLKDPTDPELAREGYAMAVASWVRSFDGPVRTVSATGVVLPASTELNAAYGAGASGTHTNAAVKLYGLILDTDVDLIWAARGSRGPRIGLDFSRNLGSNLEIHGEWARQTDVPRPVLAGSAGLRAETVSSQSALLGLRYLTQRDTTVIAEVYHNGGGYSGNELTAFYDLARSAVGDPVRTELAGRAAAQGYGRPNAAQRYAYLRISQKEPFDLLDLTPSITWIVNVGDRSWTAIPEILYTGYRNVELRLRWAANGGRSGSEFGERPVRSRIELRARVYL